MSDPGGMSGGEAAGVITASGGVLVILGKGWAWLSKHRKGRLGQLEAKVDELAAMQLDYVRQIDCLVGVCFLFVDDIGQHRPDAPVIDRCKALVGSQYPDLLRRLFPAEPVPIDMVATALRAKRKGE